MNIENRLQEIKDLKIKQEIELNNATKKVAIDFSNYISDKNIALANRWQVFLSAPEELSDQLDSFPNFHYEQALPGLDFFIENLMANNMDFGSLTVNLKEVYSMYFSKEGHINLTHVKLDLDNYSGSITDQQLNEFVMLGLEEILQCNILSFDCVS